MIARLNSRRLMRITTSLLLTAGLVLSSPIIAQSDAPLIVRHGDSSAFPVEAAAPVTTPESFFSATIGGGAPLPSDTANRPGRTDDRPRVLHTGTNEALFLNAVVPVVAPQPVLRPDWMLAHYINVGQGNATLLEFSCGIALIDTGGQGDTGRAELLAYLNKVFARRADLNRTIALVVLTHPHVDHTNGVSVLTGLGAQGFTIQHIVTNAAADATDIGFVGQKLLHDYAASHNTPITLVRNEDITRSDGLTNDNIDPLKCSPVDPDIRVLWGTDSSGHAWASNQNNDSVVVRVDFGQSSFLFTGDLQEAAQPEFLQSYVRNPDIIKADVYEVGHHGSRNGTTAALLQVIKPEIAVISAGNPADKEPGYSAYDFGHPNKVAIDFLSDPSFGVTKTRPPGSFAVGLKGKAPNSTVPPTYEMETISKAIFATGWDGDIVIAASASGEKIVQTK